MKYRSLGHCGLKVSLFSLGGWLTFGGSIKDTKSVDDILSLAYESGINFYDLADIYGNGESEKVMGKGLKKFPRHELVISSKVFWPMSEDVNDKGLSRKHIMESVDQSLKRLGTDYLDLYFCHRFDPETPLEETIRAMDDLVHQGKILYWGTSEWSADQLRQAVKLSTDNGYYRPQVEQPQYSLIVRKLFEKEIAPTAHEMGMGLVTWSPLGSGLLTGKYDQGIKEGRLSKVQWLHDALVNPENLLKIKNFKSLESKTGFSRASLAIAWAASHPYLSSVILGASSLQQLQENLKALDVPMDETLKAEIDKIF